MRNISAEAKEKIIAGAQHGAEIKRREVLERYYADPSVCKECGRVIRVPDGTKVSTVRVKQFCNASCSAKYHNKLRRIQRKEQGVYGYCRSCNKALDTKWAVYCSNLCQVQYQHEQNRPDYLAGLLGDSRKKTRRKFMLEYKPYVCCSCGNNGQWNNKSLVLEVEHIDGNSENNMPDNLDWICPNCHSQTLTYKGRNKGNGRYKRRERYTDGKSY